MITVAVVDNDRMLLEGIGSWLGSRPDLRLVATVSSVDELLRQQVRADVVLLDLLLADGSEPRDNVSRLTAADLRVLVMSVSDHGAHIRTALAAGASGYLTKDHDLADLVEAVFEVAGAAVTCSPELAMACLHDPSPDRPALSELERQVLLHHGCGMRAAAVADRLGLAVEEVAACVAGVAAKYRKAAPGRRCGLSSLTARERQIATLVTRGLTNQQIARRLNVTAKTVEKHLASTMAKLGVRSRAAVAGRIAGAGLQTIPIA